jgi:hypothetical protein
MARLDACVPRKKKDKEGNEKTFWTKIGSIWTKDDGTVSIELDALPLPDNEGRCVVKGFLPKERDQAAPRQQAAPQGGGAFQDFENDIPFAPIARKMLYAI